MSLKLFNINSNNVYVKWDMAMYKSDGGWENIVSSV